MSLKVMEILIILLTAVALTTGRPSARQSLTDSLKTNERENIITKRSVDPVDGDHIGDAEGTINVPIDPSDISRLSAYLQCASCLTECLSVRESALAYFLCKKCISDCAGNLDAFMQLFSTHKCTHVSNDIEVRPSHASNPVTSSGPPSGSDAEDHLSVLKAIGMGAESQNYEYVDDYINEKYFSKKPEDLCELKKEKYEEMEYRYTQCMTELDTLAQPPQYHPSGGEYEYLYEDPVESPDRERSNYPTIHGPGENRSPTAPVRIPAIDVRPLEQELDYGTPDPNTRNNRTAAREPTRASPSFTPNSRLVEEAHRQILEEHGSRFISEEEFKNLSTKRWSRNPQLAVLKSSRTTQRPEMEKAERKHPVCPTEFLVVSPMDVTHHTGLILQLYRTYTRVQSFWIAECQATRPTPNVIEGASCDVVHNRNKALFLTSAKLALSPNSGIENCKLHTDGSGRYLCDDWVIFPAACSLFI